MREQKKVEAEHVEHLSKYLARKMADGTLVDLLGDSGTQGAAVKALEKVLRIPDADNLQQWFDRFLSSEGRKKVWNAHRNALYSGRNPRSEQELRKAVVKRVMDWAEENGINDLNEAVTALLDKNQRGRK